MKTYIRLCPEVDKDVWMEPGPVYTRMGPIRDSYRIDVDAVDLKKAAIYCCEDEPLEINLDIKPREWWESYHYDLDPKEKAEYYSPVRIGKCPNCNKEHTITFFSYKGQSVEAHKEENCPYLHIKDCPGCGRSCYCYTMDNDEYSDD